MTRAGGAFRQPAMNTLATEPGTTLDTTVNAVGTLRAQIVDMIEGVVALLPNLLIALVILLITWLVARYALKIADALTGKTHVRPSLRQLIETLVKLAIWLVGIMIALTILMPGITPASLVAGLGIGAVAIGFAFQDVFENFLAGILIMIREKMRIGDVIECEGIAGKVERITLRETYVTALSGELTVVPNAMLFKNPVKILTDDALRRHEVVAGVSYDTDLEQARAVIRRAVEGVELVDKSKTIDVFATEFNSSSIDFLVRWWADATPRGMWESKDAVVRAIKASLDEAGIEIPFPYVTHTFKERVPLGSEPGETV